MAQAEAQRLVTANRLRDGVPVYFAGAQRWSPAIDQALLVAEGEADALLGAAQAGPPAVVAAYVIEAARTGGTVQPLGLRERIRAFGPTI